LIRKENLFAFNFKSGKKFVSVALKANYLVS
jgi:hypothetical protein